MSSVLLRASSELEPETEAEDPRARDLRHTIRRRRILRRHARQHGVGVTEIEHVNAGVDRHAIDREALLRLDVDEREVAVAACRVRLHHHPDRAEAVRAVRRQDVGNERETLACVDRAGDVDACLLYTSPSPRDS